MPPDRPAPSTATAPTGAELSLAAAAAVSVGNAVDQAVRPSPPKEMPDEVLPRCSAREGIGKHSVFLARSDSATVRWMSDPRRPGASSRDLLPAAGRGARLPVAAAPVAGLRAEGAAGLRRDELVAMLRPAPGDSRAQDAIAPYLAGTELSAEAYNEWLARVCEQPDDD